MLAVLVQSMMG